jgi:UDP-N-acetylmuramoylalanine--D-glutamate ligase
MKIALLGYGVEGRSAYSYFSRHYPDATFVIYDEAENPTFEPPAGVELKHGQNVLDQQIEADIVVRCSPPIAPVKIKTTGDVTSVTRKFLDECPAPVIGVTGSKGKGTTASLIHSILTAAGKKSWLVGNIGKSALDVLDDVSPDDVIVYELSSFQLWDVDKSPHIAVILMIEPEHLDVHSDVDDYVNAKANIRKYQSVEDVCFYHPTNLFAQRIARSGGPADADAQELWRSQASRYGIAQDGAVYVSENTFFVQSDPICSVDALQIPGIHNIENACAAISAALQYTHDYAAVEQGLRAFQGLPHRLKLVRELDGVKYYDDSIATTPGSATAALKSFDEPKVIILGGSDKGANFVELAEQVVKSDVREVITIGKMGPKIAELIHDKGFDQVSEVVGGMTAIVEAARSAAQPGDVVIMSPACASFDMFKSYVDRGEQFIAAVEKLN